MRRAALLGLLLLASPLAAKPRFLAPSAVGGGQASFVVVAPTLGALSLSPLTATAGTPWTGTIGGKNASSTVSGTAGDGTTLTIAGASVSGTFGAAGSPTITLVETLAGATNSPRSSVFTVSVSAVAAFAPSLDFSDARNSQYLLLF